MTLARRMHAIPSMRPYLLLFLIPALAHAGEPAWRFKPGTVFTWECRAESTFSSMRTFKDGSTRLVASPSSCTLTFQARVTAVGDDGSGRLDFEVKRVVLDATWHDTGAQAEWDSRTDKTVVPGFRRYAAMAGHRFSGLIGGDGKILELAGSAWPKTCELPPKERASKGEENAASTMRDPDPARTWLDMVFAGAPRAEKAWTVPFNVPGLLNMSAAPGGHARAQGTMCDVVALESGKEEGKPRKGRVWFAREPGCVLQSEMEGDEDAVRYRAGIDQRVRWTAKLTSREEGPLK
jgi:hypothetical protein